MRVKLDENVPAYLAARLHALGHDADTVEDEALRGADDEDVWGAAQREGRFLVTQDLDFSDARRFPPGTHAGILLLRLDAPARRTLEAHLLRLFETQPVETWRGALVVSTERHLRVRRT